MELPEDFFNNDVEIVAKELLGKLIVRKINKKELVSRIVETEAYFGKEDPASRARQNGDLRITMEMKAGTILVYGVHNNWLLNIVTGNKGLARAVLIRAVEPINFNYKCNGPGLLTRSLNINKKFHKKSIFNNGFLSIKDNIDKDFQIIESFRIGVSKDLSKPYRYYIKDNSNVSKK
jgi:DNA-3-methyladenine glycosylase